MAAEKVTYNACQGWGCHEHCVLTTHSSEGRILRTEQTPLPKSFGVYKDGFGICQRGIDAAKFPYLSDRVLYPLKRTGQRGEGKFERISWEQALDEIGGKINEITKEYGPRSLIVNTFPCGYPNNTNGLGFYLWWRFVHSFDATLFEEEVIDTVLLHSAPIDFGEGLMMCLLMNPELLAESKNMIIIWGSGAIGSTRAARTSRLMLDAQERGVKLVDIGLLYDSCAAKCDQFIRVNAGTDAALALAMANVIIDENLCDEKFLAEKTVAPFLVREDNGQFLRESDIVTGGDPGKYVYWNMVPPQAQTVAANTPDFGGSYPDLEAEVSVNGIRCKTAFLRLRENVAPWTPQSQERITGVPSKVVLDLAREYAQNKPSTIFLNLGMRYMNNGRTGRAIDLLPVLTGNLGYRSGFLDGPLGDGHPVGLNIPGIIFPQGPQNAKGARLSMIELLDSLEKPNAQKYKAWMNCFSNPVQNWPNRQLWSDRVFPAMDLLVTFEVRMSDTAMFADYILPEASIFERHELISTHGDCIILNEPAIEPQGESKPPADILREFSKRVGVGELFDRSTSEWLETMLETDDPTVSSVRPPITLGRLEKEKIIRLNTPESVFNFWDLPLKTPSGRVEFYCEDLAGVGGAMACYSKPQIQGPKREKYPLQFYPGRHRFFMQGQFQELPELRAIAGKVATVALNPATAASRGIGEGDWVEVYNDRGTVRAVAHLSEEFPPDMAHLWYSYSAKDYPTNPPTVLSTALGTRDSQDAIARKWEKVWQQRNSAAGAIPTATFYWTIDTYDPLWDDLCEVRKVEGGK